MKEVVKEYAGSVLAACAGVMLFSTLGQLLLSKQGLVMQMILMWGKGGCG